MPQITPKDTYLPQYTNIVDYDAATGNLLFRGNCPIRSTSPYLYAYYDLDQTVTSIVSALATQQPGLRLPADFTLARYNLLDINLLDNQGDVDDWTAVCDSFGVDTASLSQWPPYSVQPWLPSTLLGNGMVMTDSEPQPGNMVWWPFEPEMNQLASGCQFDGLVAYANAQLRTAPPAGSNPTVIYVHCDSGVNRTGTFVAAYLLNYGSSIYPGITTLEEACNNATVPVSGTIQYPAKGGYFSILHSYCKLLGNKETLRCSYDPNK